MNVFRAGKYVAKIDPELSTIGLLDAGGQVVRHYCLRGQINRRFVNFVNHCDDPNRFEAIFARYFGLREQEEIGRSLSEAELAAWAAQPVDRYDPDFAMGLDADGVELMTKLECAFDR